MSYARNATARVETKTGFYSFSLYFYPFFSIVECPGCHGRGIQIQRAQIAPGFVQQVQRTCQECRGEGQIIKDICKACKGKKRVEQEEILEVHIDKGMKDGQKILFRNKGDEEPGLEAGDIVIVLDEVEHEKYTRKDDNLIMFMELKLVEALCGCTKYIETLDGRQLMFNLLPGNGILDPFKIIEHHRNFTSFYF